MVPSAAFASPKDHEQQDHYHRFSQGLGKHYSSTGSSKVMNIFLFSPFLVPLLVVAFMASAAKDFLEDAKRLVTVEDLKGC